mgnify:CR=1 FL=1
MENITKYQFVRIPKTASTSICQALGKMVEHKTVLELKQEIPNWNDIYSFSIIRDPYDRFISMYYFFSVFGRAYKENEILQKRDINEFLEDYNFQTAEIHPDFRFVRPQTTFLLDEDQKIGVKKLLRFESLAIEWPQLLETLGYAPKPLPHLRKWHLRPEKVELTPLSKRRIYEYYERDFRLLGYNK